VDRAARVGDTRARGLRHLEHRGESNLQLMLLINDSVCVGERRLSPMHMLFSLAVRAHMSTRRNAAVVFSLTAERLDVYRGSS
jgi:hypothetical protein